MDSILSALTNSQTEIAVIKEEKFDEDDICNEECMSVKYQSVGSESQNPGRDGESYRIWGTCSDGLEEDEVDLADISTKQQILKETSNPTLLLFVTNHSEGEFGTRKTNVEYHRKNNFKRRRKKSSAESKKEAFNCDKCDKSFSKQMYLISHSIKHKNHRSLKCSNCKQMFKHKASLSLHMKIHLSNEDSSCADCQKTPNDEKCSKHEKSNAFKYNCLQCDKNFQTKQSYEAHCFMHDGRRPYKCRICPKTFLYKHTLNKHTMDHNKIKREKKFKCDRCEKSYEFKSELNRHYAHHSDEKAWLCTICGKTYAIQATLKTHLKTHEPGKAYECDLCESSFMKKSILEIHIKKIHNKESPAFMCDRCPKQFYSRDGLKQHMIIHSSDKKFKCDVCFKLFLTNSRFLSHKKKIHRN